MKAYYVARIGEDEDGAFIDEIGIFASVELATIGIKSEIMRQRNRGIELTPDDYHTKVFTLRETPLQAQVMNETDSTCITCHPEEGE
jgi:hypothetical protein